MTIIARYLSAEDVLIDLDVAAKDQALELAAETIERRHHVDRGLVYRALWRREQLGSTAVGNGLAIPHARIAHIGAPIILLIRTRRPIEFGPSNRHPVSTLLVVLVPEQANDEHLSILAAASQFFSDAGFRGRLERAAEPAAIAQLFLGDA